MAEQDRNWMLRAIELARQGEGSVEPNPMVGCVVVRNGAVIGEGYHEKFGGLHAERNALQAVTNRAECSGATVYVSLEPCCHVGKTPACTEALIEAGVSRVVVAHEDPFPAVAGKGIEQLRQHGISVEVGLCQDEAAGLCAPFFKRVRTGLPWVIAKWAMSLDGRIATRQHDSQWISGPESRQQVHELRSRVDAVVVGRGTAQLDDPSLNARGVLPLRQATRVVVDSNASLSENSKLAQTATEQPVLLWSGPDHDARQTARLRDLGVDVQICDETDRNARLKALLKHLGDKGATNVLVEGGGELLGSLADLRQIDQCEIFVGPKLIGGNEAPGPLGGLGIPKLGDSPQVHAVVIKQLGQDAHISCRLHAGDGPLHS
jgi:diaminohydroxyphosphoribosylaminopyrimidine deaminase/5-amino-6-(5-phosphoribosylamino)uracil reductase